MVLAPREKEYDFTLVLTGVNTLTDDIADALFEAGCDDATPSIRSGRLFLTFSRVASSRKDAILRAIHDVRRADIGIEVLRVDESNLVTQSDIARKTGRSRQQIHQYVTGERGPGGFPPPARFVGDEAPMWYWSEVAHWLWRNNMLEEDARRDAEELAVINSVLNLSYQKHAFPDLTDEVLRGMGMQAGSANG